MLNGHLSDQVAQGYCTSQPKVQLTDDGFEVEIRSLDVPGVVGHIRQDRKMWFTVDSGDGGEDGAASAKGPTGSVGPNKHKGQRQRHLRQ